jgi:hypothetical protein
MGAVNGAFQNAFGYLRKAFGPPPVAVLSDGTAVEVTSSSFKGEEVLGRGGTRTEYVLVLFVSRGAIADGAIVRFQGKAYKVRHVSRLDLCGDVVGDRVEALDIQGT